MTQGTNKEVALNCIQRYSELANWLEACPAEDGQPYYETAIRDFEGYAETGHQALWDMNQHELADRFLKIINGECDEEQIELGKLVKAIEAL